MKYYLLSEQDINEYFWEIENTLLEIKSCIESKELTDEEDQQNYAE